MKQYRHLRSGDIVMVESDEPPVVYRAAANPHSDSFLRDAHLYEEEGGGENRLSVERSFASFLVCILAFSLMAIAYKSYEYPFGFGTDWRINGIPFWLEITYVLSVALCTSFLHELGHIFFGKSFAVSVDISKSTFHTNLNHIWVWPASARFSAIASGLIIDFLCVCLIMVFAPAANPLALSAISTIILRIAWQFNVTRKTDGRWILCLLFDDPMMMVHAENGRFAFLIRLFGLCYDILLLIMWPTLFLLNEIGVDML